MHFSINKLGYTLVGYKIYFIFLYFQFFVTYLLEELLERTQRKAARWISNDFKQQSSVSSMLKKLDLASLEDRRCDARLVLLYKILHQNVAVPMDDLGIERSPRATRGLYTKDKLLYSSTSMQNDRKETAFCCQNSSSME